MSTIQYEPRDKILLVTSHRKTMTSQLFFQNSLISGSLGVANFTSIIKIAIILIKTTHKELITIKRIRKNVPKCSFLSVFLDITKIVKFW